MIDFKLIRSQRKTLSLEINKKAELVIRAPLKLSQQEILKFIDSHASWIKEKQIASKEKRQSMPSFTEGDIFHFLGEPYPLSFKNIDCNIQLKDQFEIHTDHQKQARHVLFHWYKQQASHIIPERAQAFRKHFEFGSLRISKAASYWGVCNKHNDLAFNWRIIMAPIPVIDYLITHECVHTKIRNHSKQFWALVEKYCPAYRQHERWLKDHNYFIEL